MPGLRTVRVTRYVTPLREGGSLPAIVEADDDGMYVLKFRGAGQGVRALVAELVSGEMARALGLPIPELVFAELDPDLARTEPDPEIQALIRASGGLNLAIDYLPGSVMFDPVASRPEPNLASQIVWFDAFVSNVDRTARNTNMLMWHRRLWLIDHGASLYFHHAPGWCDNPTRARDPFRAIKDHVLLPIASELTAVDADMTTRLTADVIDEVLELIPAEWLVDGATGSGRPGESGGTRQSELTELTERSERSEGAERSERSERSEESEESEESEPPRPDDTHWRAAYRRYILDRLTSPRPFVEEAVRAR